MVAQAGQDVLIQIDMNNEDDFKTIGGLRASKFTLNSQSVNVTNMGSEGQWREILEGAGVRSATISGSGVFVDDATDKRMQALFFAGSFPRIRMRIPDFGDMIAKFQILSLEFSGNYDGEANYALSFASSGLVEFYEHEVTG